MAEILQDIDEETRAIILAYLNEKKLQEVYKVGRF